MQRINILLLTKSNPIKGFLKIHKDHCFSQEHCKPPLGNLVQVHHRKFQHQGSVRQWAKVCGFTVYSPSHKCERLPLCVTHLRVYGLWRCLATMGPLSGSCCFLRERVTMPSSKLHLEWKNSITPPGLQLQRYHELRQVQNFKTMNSTSADLRDLACSADVLVHAWEIFRSSPAARSSLLHSSRSFPLFIWASV